MLGTGTVGKAIASKLVALGHEVTMCSRSVDNEAAVAWAEHAGEGDAAPGAMVDPARVPGDHDVFICCDDEAAKAQVRDLLSSFGWPAGSIIDLGDISTTRGTKATFLAELHWRPHSGL